MDDEKLDSFKNMLLQKQNLLRGTVQRTEDYGREKDQNTQDMADKAAESYTRDFLFGKSAGDRQVLREIQAALARIDNKAYGICTNCGDDINVRRLEAVPWAEMCIKCRELLEKGLLD